MEIYMKSDHDKNIENEELGWSQWQIYCVFGGAIFLLIGLVASEYFKTH